MGDVGEERYAVNGHLLHRAVHLLQLVLLHVDLLVASLQFGVLQAQFACMLLDEALLLADLLDALAHGLAQLVALARKVAHAPCVDSPDGCQHQHRHQQDKPPALIEIGHHLDAERSHRGGMHRLPRAYILHLQRIVSRRQVGVGHAVAPRWKFLPRVVETRHTVEEMALLCPGIVERGESDFECLLILGDAVDSRKVVGLSRVPDQRREDHRTRRRLVGVGESPDAQQAVDAAEEHVAVGETQRRVPVELLRVQSV